MSPRCREMAVYFLICLPALACGYYRVYKPSGILLCLRHCDGCQSLTFLRSHLMCQVFDNRSADLHPSMWTMYNLFRSYKDADRRFRGKSVRCYPMPGFGTHRKGNPYIQWDPTTRLCRVDTVKLGVMANLLILPSFFNGARPQARQLNLYSQTVSLESISASNIEIIAYMSGLNKLLMAKPKKQILTFLDLETRAWQPMKLNVVIKGLAVDEVRQLVFMTVSNPVGMVRSMTTSGKDFKTVATLGCSVGGIAVDPEHSTFYVVCVHQRLLYFDGIQVQPRLIDFGEIQSPICLDAERGILYYIKRSTLFRKSVPNDMSERMVVDLGLSVRNLVVFGKNLYADDGRDLIVVDENNHYHKKSAMKTGYSGAVSSVCFCAIP